MKRAIAGTFASKTLKNFCYSVRLAVFTSFKILPSTLPLASLKTVTKRQVYKKRERKLWVRMIRGKESNERRLLERESEGGSIRGGGWAMLCYKEEQKRS